MDLLYGKFKVGEKCIFVSSPGGYNNSIGDLMHGDIITITEIGSPYIAKITCERWVKNNSRYANNTWHFPEKWEALKSLYVAKKTYHLSYTGPDLFQMAEEQAKRKEKV